MPEENPIFKLEIFPTSTHIGIAPPEVLTEEVADYANHLMDQNGEDLSWEDAKAALLDYVKEQLEPLENTLEWLPKPDDYEEES